MKQFLGKLADGFVAFRMRSSRGNGLMSEVMGILNAATTGGVIILVMDRYFHFLLPLWSLAVIYVAQKVFEYLLGWWDEKKGKMWSREAAYGPTKVDPWSQQLMFREKDNNKILRDKFYPGTYDDDWQKQYDKLKDEQNRADNTNT